MKLSNKTILILIFLLCGILIVSVQKNELNIEMLMENTESREVVIINARVTSIPFKRYFVKGTISMKNRVFQIYKLVHIMTPRENEHIYMIFFRELDHKSIYNRFS
ncbi:MAG: hypothetical protein LR001_05260 [Clostridiales bacterium]|nr:hypothetical protein [Clostridiales bacterium]